MNERIYVAVDVETTGLVPGTDELIEVAAVTFRRHELLDTYSQLVQPRQPLPLKITRLTGIAPKDVAEAPFFNMIGGDFARFIKSYPIVGHSVSFDLSMLRAQGMNFTQPTYDTFELATLLMPQAPIYKLSALAERIGVPHPDAHRALNDAIVTAHVFNHLLGLLEALSLDALNEIMRLINKIDFSMRDLFEHTLREKTRNAFFEPALPGRIQPPPTIFDIAPPPGSGEPQPLKPTGDARPLDYDEIAAFFAPDGPLGQQFPGYEPRAPQVHMAQAVAEAFNLSEPLLVEAGTGTGKSLSYLIPSVFFATRRGERVVISTNTINLQDQLFFKDLPALQTIMAASSMPPFTASLLKGRGNYLCLKRYYEMQRSENLNPDEVRMLLKVQLWVPTTENGDKAELLLMDRENGAWNRVNVTPETCIGSRCPHFRECFFFKARRQAEAAHILVVNHALLIADLAAQAHVLPPYAHLIVDEAHNLEDVATDQLSFKVDQAAMLKFLDDIFQTGGAQVVSGLLSELPAALQAGVDELVAKKIAQASDLIRPALVRARTAVYECFNLLNAFVIREGQDNQYDPRLRLTPGIREKVAWQEVQVVWANMTDILTVIGTGLAQIEEQLRNLDASKVDGYEELLLQVEYLGRFAVDVRVKTGHIIFGDEAIIAWLTLDRQRDTLTLTAAPLSVADMLQAQLFAQKATSVLASATLTIEANFEFVKDRLGLPEANELELESPFDYEKQALVYIPSDIPEPNQRGYQQAIEQALIELCTVTGGRTLALFTANNALRQTYHAIQEPLEAQEIAVLAQGIDGSRRALLDRFKEFPRTVLLGTNSFWEGVDVVGDALSVLVITKLPFSVPNDPIFAARSERFQDPFGEFSVPQTILRFKQGFGRLIRSREDRGIVVVLDRRLLSKKYGQQFLDSLPNTRVRTGPLNQLPVLGERFLK
ncbi:helicase C-terminal domain-containing protein [Candidatus Chloroploca sp. Khr17]|uniref:helicase C-terminal domain-containing protein n=1 Tax=Candidatus Chloroploca sp. Khr17 TaxID=2496869 RepID=UPI00101D5464|nr:helicase C-terminal domain-containing protein [Candidatus Chloroploca sp. Khr17]